MPAFDIVDTVKKYKKIVAWGAGCLFEKHYSLLDGKLTYIVDRNSELWGEKKNGIEIRSPEELQKRESLCHITIKTLNFT